MKIDANDKEIQDIFSLGYFNVPRFQRPYSWGDDEVTRFWEDVTGSQSEDYFIGSMVVYQTKKPYFGIVDGQQRLTTITLMLAALRNAFIRLHENNSARGVHNFIERPNVENFPEFILKSETSFPYLQTHIQKYDGLQVRCEAGAEELNLQAAFNLIERKLESVVPSMSSPQTNLFDCPAETVIEVLKEIRDKVLSLKLVFIQLDNEDDAYLIFETLNARGRDLTTPDLVKNLLLKRIRSSNADLDAAKVAWNHMVRRFDDVGVNNGMEPFLYHYGLSLFEYTTEKQLFGKIKAHSDSSAVQLLEDLQVNVDYYLCSTSPESVTWTMEERAVQESLRTLRSFGVKQQSPMTLALIRAYRNKKITLRELQRVLEKIEHFHYVFNAVTSQRSSGSISTMYSKYAIALSHHTDHSAKQRILNGLLDELNTKLPSFSEYTASFEDRIYTSKLTKHKNVIKYTLQKMMGNAAQGLSIDFNTMTIEHIVPEANIPSGALC